MLYGGYLLFFAADNVFLSLNCLKVKVEYRMNACNYAFCCQEIKHADDFPQTKVGSPELVTHPMMQ